MACTQRVVNMIHLHLVSATNRSETRTHGNTAESGPLSTYESISVASYVISHPSASNTTLTCTSTPPHESDLPRNKNKNIISALLASTGHSSAAGRWWSEEEERQRQQRGANRRPDAGHQALGAVQRDQGVGGAPNARRERRRRGEAAGGARSRRAASCHGAACQKEKTLRATTCTFLNSD